MITTEIEGATVRKQVGVSSTEYHVSGVLEAVLKVIAGLFVNFPAHGYGTHLHGMGMDTGGAYFARVSHMNSCD